jgi:hypothetical protein
MKKLLLGLIIVVFTIIFGAILGHGRPINKIGPENEGPKKFAPESSSSIPTRKDKTETSPSNQVRPSLPQSRPVNQAPEGPITQ